MPRIAINGFGRIGRAALKAGSEKRGFDVIAVNDLADAATLAHLLRHDTAYGAWNKRVSFDKEHLVIDGKKIALSAEKDPALLPWKRLKIDVVLECTGRFTDLIGASGHLAAGAARVIISAPAKGGVPTHVMGVNGRAWEKKTRIINNASCTTNCIAPVAAVMEDAFGVKKAMMTTIHAYTAEQNLVDGPPPGLKSGDLRRARAAAQNMIPTTTGAAVATTETVPELKDRFDGIAIRVPIVTGSLSDMTVLIKKKTTVEAVRQVFIRAAKQGRWKGILDVTDEPLVSSDFIGHPASAIVDLSLIKVVDGDLVKIVAWYDNEWGYANRLVEMALAFAE